MARVAARSADRTTGVAEGGEKKLPRHPAPFSNAILDRLQSLVPPGRYLDPFCGVGRVFQLTMPGEREFDGVELEEEWAAQAREKMVAFGGGEATGQVITADALVEMAGMKKKLYDGIVTSPVYGNRMSDHHDAKDMSTRRSYTHDLGRKLTEGNSGTMYFWQDEYKDFHTLAWKLAHRVTRKGGLMFLNVSDFIRNGEIMEVVKWHGKALRKAGWVEEDCVDVGTPRMRDGANSELRVDTEAIIVARRV